MEHGKTHRRGRGDGVALEGGGGEGGRVVEGGDGGRSGMRVHELILSRAVRAMAVGGICGSMGVLIF